MSAKLVSPPAATGRGTRIAAVSAAVLLVLTAAGCATTTDPQAPARHDGVATPRIVPTPPATGRGGGPATAAPAGPDGTLATDQPIGLRFPPAPASLDQLHVPPGHGATVSLTFDDGPSPAATATVLALLADAHAHAVFCLIGQLAVTYPALVRQEVAAGNPLCDHSRDHDLAMQHRPARYQSAEVLDGLGDIRAASGGAPVPFYRQPGGLWTRTVVETAYAHDMLPLRWTDDPRDWSRPSVPAIAQRVLLRLRPGAVVLLHDGGGDRSPTIAALRWLLPHLQAAGWTFTLPRAVRLPVAQASRPE